MKISQDDNSTDIEAVISDGSGNCPFYAADISASFGHSHASLRVEEGEVSHSVCIQFNELDDPQLEMLISCDQRDGGSLQVARFILLNGRWTPAEIRHRSTERQTQ